MHVPLPVTLLLLLSPSSMSISAAVPLPESGSSLAAASCHINTTSPIVQPADTISSIASSARTPTPTPAHSSYITASNPIITDRPSVPLIVDSGVATPSCCLSYLPSPESTNCHLNTDKANSSSRAEPSTKQGVDLNTIVSISLGAAQVLLSIFPTQAAWRFLHHHGHGGVNP
ncbi:hypothetical protein GJ744_012021 [Endocarpon pusillum]|uniref:Hydrophobin n=1 Tax=Endocarpon pusillum TaxID=364733 RepID=A0A8H7API6_9EURO|nr:hypothetical protein GJ744_012021 [Endocarpon pusillum]